MQELQRKVAESEFLHNTVLYRLTDLQTYPEDGRYSRAILLPEPRIVSNHQFCYENETCIANFADMTRV